MDFSPVTFEALLYDGASANARDVRVTLEPGGRLSVCDAGGLLGCFERQQIEWEPPVGSARLIFKLQNGMQLETAFNEGLVSALLRHFPQPGGLLRRLEQRVTYAMLLLAAALAMGAAVYIWGIPATARLLRPFIPYSWKQEAGGQIGKILDRYFFTPSKLPAETQQRVQAMLERAAPYTSLKSVPQVRLRTLTKADKKDGKTAHREVANTFALLPDSIWVTDTLLEQLSDAEVEGILAHEIGHLERDHGTLALLKTSISSALTLFMFGLDPNALQGVALALVDSNYSQNQEREADAYAAELLLKEGKTPQVLVSALQRLTRNSRNETVLDKYMSTHPLTAERVAFLEAAGRRPE